MNFIKNIKNYDTSVTKGKIYISMYYNVNNLSSVRKKLLLCRVLLYGSLTVIIKCSKFFDD